MPPAGPRLRPQGAAKATKMRSPKSTAHSRHHLFVFLSTVVRFEAKKLSQSRTTFAMSLPPPEEKPGAACAVGEEGGREEDRAGDPPQSSPAKSLLGKRARSPAAGEGGPRAPATSAVHVLVQACATGMSERSGFPALSDVGWAAF